MYKAHDHPNPNTVTVESQGGIGNQLFIYAFARELQLRSDFPVALDIWRHQLPNARPFQISRIIGNHLPVVNSASTLTQPISGQLNLLRHFMQSATSRLHLGTRTIFEKKLSFDPEYFLASPGSRLIGYFQSWKYFETIAGTFWTEFCAVRSQLTRGTAFASPNNRAAVHIRLGDFTQPRYRHTHGTVGAGYYQQAIQRILESRPDSTFVIFSDEPEGARRMLLESVPSAAIQVHETLGTDFMDLLAMSTFERIVCANSSFSWWAAWLSGLPGDRISVPRHWVNRTDFEAQDLFPRDWTVFPLSEESGSSGEVLRRTQR